MFGLSSIQAILISAAFSALVAAVGAGIVVHKIDNARYLTLQRDYATAETRAIKAAKELQAAQDKTVLDAAVAEASAQIKIVTRVAVLKQEVPRYVTNTVPCISVGFVRVLDAAVLGVAPADLPLAAGELDDTCTTLSNAEVAGAIVANYGTASANAEQLNALETSVRTIHSAVPQ